jgi:phytoene desaturase
MTKKVIVIGSGFAGLSAATNLAHKGFEVTILEKNDQPGGRARSFSVDGYTFDMGPSWYWMPDVFENYFGLFGKKVSDYYQVTRLDPSYRVFFGENDFVDLPASLKKLYALFEEIEPGSGEKLESFLAESAYKYETGMKDLVYMPGRKISELADMRIVKGLFQLHLLKSMRSYVYSHFSNSRLRQIVEFPILFLGGTPQNTPALYSLMNYADMSLGTWFPKGGMTEIVKAMVQLAKDKGVRILLNEEVKSFQFENGKISAVHTTNEIYDADVIVAGADYHHVEQQLLPKQYRQYSPSYWEKRKLAPSSLLFYLGVNKKIKGLLHHTLFFDANFDEHADEIYKDPKWPTTPLFYASCTSKTDDSVAPEGCENIFLLMPVAPGLKDDIFTREKYYELMMDRLETLTGESIKDHVVYKRSYAQKDFIDDYHSFKGNAYGLANTLTQTAILKPGMKSKKVENLYYTGQLTVPGPGVPPALISGQVVAQEVEKEQLKKQRA